jgi:hypothetical protein
LVSLERKFGIDDPNQVDPVKKFFSNTGEGFSFDLGINKDAVAADTSPLYAGDKTGDMMAETAAALSKSNSRRPSTVPNRVGSIQALNTSPGRSDKAPLPINALTQDALRNSLVASMVRDFTKLLIAINDGVLYRKKWKACTRTIRSQNEH